MSIEEKKGCLNLDLAFEQTIHGDPVPAEIAGNWCNEVLRADADGVDCRFEALGVTEVCLRVLHSPEIGLRSVGQIDVLFSAIQQALVDDSTMAQKARLANPSSSPSSTMVLDDDLSVVIERQFVDENDVPKVSYTFFVSASNVQGRRTYGPFLTSWQHDRSLWARLGHQILDALRQRSANAPWNFLILPDEEAVSTFETIRNITRIVEQSLRPTRWAMSHVKYADRTDFDPNIAKESWDAQADGAMLFVSRDALFRFFDTHGAHVPMHIYAFLADTPTPVFAAYANEFVAVAAEEKWVRDTLCRIFGAPCEPFSLQEHR